MATHIPIYCRWNPPIETRLPDIHGWLEDIHAAQDYTSRLSHELDTENPDRVILDALLIAVLVRYSRCFTTGIRARLSIEELPTATPSDVELHERIRGVRDWHIAHPVNEQEVHALYVMVDGSPGATTGAIGLSSFSSANAHLELFDPKEMSALFQKWIRWLNAQMIQENAPLIPLANRLSRAELLALPQDEPQPNPNIRAKRRQAR